MSRILESAFFLSFVVRTVALFPANSCDSNCSSFTCVPGTFLVKDPAISACSLTGYYAFDQGGFLTDSSVSQVNLAVYLSLAGDTAPVQSSSCLFSNGCASFSTGGFKAGNLRIVAGQGLSICSWYQVGAVGTLQWSRLFDFGNGPGMSNILLSRYGSTNKLSFAVYDSAGTAQVADVVVSSNAFAVTGQWNHYCLIYDGGYGFKVYLNGALETSATVPTVDTALRTSNFIGKSARRVEQRSNHR
jgi:hypothetical protein